MAEINKEDTKEKNRENIENNNVKNENTKEIKDSIDKLKNNKEKKEKNNLEINKVKELTSKIKELEDNYLRIYADFENYRKRTQKELEEAKENGKIELIEEIIPILDNIEASLKLKNSNPEMIIKGIEMILKNFYNILERHNIKVYEPKILEEFDPKIHDPLIVDEGKEEGKVLGVINKGFIYKERILRPSKVKIKKKTDNDNKEM